MEAMFAGKCPRKWLAIRAQVERKLAMLQAAHTLEFLCSPPGNRLEALRGKRRGQHSVRINDQWRICLRWSESDVEYVEIVDFHQGMTMTKNALRPIHPGEILREEFLAPLGMSAHALAVALRVPAPRINDIVRERRGVSPDTALHPARYFGGDAESWLSLQVAHDLRVAEIVSAEKITKEVDPHAA